MTLWNQPRAQAVLAARSIDALVASRPEHVRYLSDTDTTVASTMGLDVATVLVAHPVRVAAIIAPVAIAGHLAHLASLPERVELYGSFFVAAASASQLDDVEQTTARLLRTGTRRVPSFIDAVTTVLASLGLDKASVGFDDPMIAAQVTDRLAELNSVDGEEALRVIRLVKTPEELRRLERAAAIAEKVEAFAIERARPGFAWAEFVASMPARVSELGGSFGFFSGGAGRRSSFLFEPGPGPLVAGDLIRLDLTIAYRGYWSDTGRTISIGTPTASALSRFRAVHDAVAEALDLVRPGVTLSSIYAAAVAVARRSIPGFQRHHCGHTIGLRPYDGSLVSANDATVLEAGVVLNIEVPYYELGWGGLQVEQTVVVETDGHRRLTHLPTNMFVTT